MSLSISKHVSIRRTLLFPIHGQVAFLLDELLINPILQGFPDGSPINNDGAAQYSDIYFPVLGGELLLKVFNLFICGAQEGA